jgi:hypothetical protein
MQVANISSNTRHQPIVWRYLEMLAESLTIAGLQAVAISHSPLIGTICSGRKDIFSVHVFL